MLLRVKHSCKESISHKSLPRIFQFMLTKAANSPAALLEALMHFPIKIQSLECAAKDAQEMGCQRAAHESQRMHYEQHRQWPSHEHRGWISPFKRSYSSSNLQISLEQRRHHQQRASSACHSCSLEGEGRHKGVRSRQGSTSTALR